MSSKDKQALGFLARHMIYGATGGFVFGASVIALDIADLRTLIMTSDSPFLALFMLFFGLFVTFGSAGVSVGIMSQAEDRN